MSEREGGVAIRKILVALDASHHSLAALRGAAKLARSLEAELEGLFVEDVELLKVAGFPMARELQLPFGALARLDPARMERQLRAQAVQAREALASVCREERIEWTFRVVRGDVSATILEAAARADLLSLGKASRPLIRRKQTGSTARTAATQAPRSVLLIPRDAVIRPPIVVPHDGTDRVRRSLVLAAQLAGTIGGYLSVLVLSDEPDVGREVQTQIGDWLGGRDLVVRYRELAGDGVRTLLNGVRTEGGGLLVLSGAIFAPDDLDTLLDALEYPVLLVR
jgi:nucleotide-binding universal stress UspA family protein